MIDNELISTAAEFLRSQEIGFVEPGKIGRKDDVKVEVIFPVPETLDPNVAIVDPPDVRVWVHTGSKEVRLIHQM